MSPTHQDLSNDTTFSQIKSRVPVPLIKAQAPEKLSTESLALTAAREVTQIL